MYSNGERRKKFPQEWEEFSFIQFPEFLRDGERSITKNIHISIQREKFPSFEFADLGRITVEWYWTLCARNVE